MKEIEGWEGQTAYVEGARDSRVQGCAEVCAWYAYVCMHMCHVLCMLIYLSIMYMSICVAVSVSLH